MSWDKTKPVGASAISDGDDWIRANWAALESSIGAEHQFSAGDQAGNHLSGSARISITSEAAKAALNKAQGRLAFCLDSKKLYYADGESWVQLNPATINEWDSIMADGSENPQTASTEFADISADFSVTLVTKGGHLLISLNYTAYNDTANKDIYFNLKLNGTDLTNLANGFGGLLAPSAALAARGTVLIQTRTVTAPAAGSQVIIPRWRVTGGTAKTLQNFKNSLVVVEI